MNTRQQPINRKALPIPVGLPLVWAVLGVTLVIALAITLATQLTPAPKVSKPAVNGQTVPDANTQAVLDYLRAHGYGQPSPVQAVPDANTQAVMDYLRAHGYGQPSAVQAVPGAIAQSYFLQLFPSQAVPDPNTKAVLDYLSAHGVAADRSFPVPAMSDYGQGAPTGQTVPDAIAQSYFLQLLPSQAAPDPNTKGVMDYLRAHGVAAAAGIRSAPVLR